MLESLCLDSKVVIVTGGGTGLGRAMVRALAKAGAELVIAARRLDRITEAAHEITSLGGNALAIPTDVTDSSQVNDMVLETIKRFGRVDVLINNAGMVRENVRAPIWEVTDEQWRSGIDANLTSAFYCSRAVTESMKKRGSGKIINMASGYGLRGGRDIYMYCCGKGGIIQLTRALAISLARYGITANTIVAGFIPTEGTASMQENLPRSTEFIPVGRVGNPEEIGPIAVFLASEASSYMNGEMITLDGGSLAGGLAPTGENPFEYLEL